MGLSSRLWGHPLRAIHFKEETIWLCHPFASRLAQALSAAKDAKRRDDKPEAASFDSQNVFFEMYCPLRVPCELRNGLQVQDHLLDIRGRVRTTTGIRVALIGPSGEVPGGVLVVVSASPQGNKWLVLDEDLLDALDSLLLRSRISGRSILVQEIVGCRIVPGHEVELALADLSAVQVLIVQVIWSGATNHTTAQ